MIDPNCLYGLLLSVWLRTDFATIGQRDLAAVGGMGAVFGNVAMNDDLIPWFERILAVLTSDAAARFDSRILKSCVRGCTSPVPLVYEVFEPCPMNRLSLGISPVVPVLAKAPAGILTPASCVTCRTPDSFLICGK